MNRLVWVLLTAVLCLVGASGCSSTCGNLCDKLASCPPGYIDANWSSCRWDNDQDAIEEACQEGCEEEYEDLTESGLRDVDDCFECVEEAVGDSCAAGRLRDAQQHECGDVCADLDVNEFFGLFLDEWKPDIDC